MWRHYLYGETYEIFTNHKSLKYLFKQKELNMRHHRWMDLFKDFDCNIYYHQGKGNIVADTLSQKSICMMARAMLSNWKDLETIQELQWKNYHPGYYVASLRIQAILIPKIKDAQMTNTTIQSLKKETKQNLKAVRVHDDGILRFKTRLCLLDDKDMRKHILEKA